MKFGILYCETTEEKNEIQYLSNNVIPETSDLLRFTDHRHMPKAELSITIAAPCPDSAVTGQGYSVLRANCNVINKVSRQCYDLLRPIVTSGT